MHALWRTFDLLADKLNAYPIIEIALVYLALFILFVVVPAAFSGCLRRDG